MYKTRQTPPPNFEVTFLGLDALNTGKSHIEAITRGKSGAGDTHVQEFSTTDARETGEKLVP